jgi:uncharacterized repeat protein (TIGR01451 family)
MKFAEFRHFASCLLIAYLSLFCLAPLRGQSIELDNLGGGYVMATITGTCPGGSLSLNWGDMCSNNSTNTTIIHQYLDCGTFALSLTCNGPGGTMLLATNTVTVTIASVNIVTSATSTASDCGSEEEFILRLSRDAECGTTPGNVTVTAQLPPGLAVVGGDFSVIGNNVSLIIPGASLAVAPAVTVKSLRVRPLPCSGSNTLFTIPVTATVPFGTALNDNSCNTIIASPPNTSSIVTNWKFVPKAPCLTISKSSSTPTITAGGTAQYTVTVTNTGNWSAQNVRVEDALPAGLTPTALPPNTSTSGGIATTPISVVGAGASQTLSYTFVQVPVPCQLSAEYKNCATAHLPACGFSTPPACASVMLSQPPPVLNANFTFTALDCNTLRFTPVSDLPGQTHSWTFGNGNSSSLANPVNSYANGTFTIQHTLTECGVSVTSTQTVTIDCPPPPPPVCECKEAGMHIGAGPGGNTYSELEQMFNFDANNDGKIDLSEHKGCISITGDLVIDQDLIITDCSEIRMQPCASITVQPQRHLTMTQNIISGCVQMWRGITVEPLGWLTFQNNRVSDAQHAITAKGSIAAGIPASATRIEVRQNTFLRNHIGLLTTGLAGASLYHQPITRNTFIGNGMSLPPCDAGLPNWDANNGYAGVVSQNVSLSIGAANDIGISNTFSALRNGVIGENCWMQVHHASFTDMVGQWVTEGQEPSLASTFGMGVFTHTGFTSVSGSYFNGCGHGIYSRTGALTAVGNNMPDVRRGIEISSPIACVLSENTEIVYRNKGIIGRNLQTGPLSPWLQYAINKNTLRNLDQANLEGDAGIHIINADQSDQTNARMSENKIFLDAPSEGIRVVGVGKWIIDRNYVQCKPFNGAPISGTGIQLLASQGNYAYANTMEDISGPGALSTAFSVSSSPQNTFCCNVTDGNRLGFRFFGACNATSFRTTDMSAHQFCIDIIQNSTIGEQGVFDVSIDDYINHRNWFNNTSGTARHLDDNALIITASRFHVLSTLTPDFPVAVSTPNAPNVTWFDDDGVGNPVCDACVEPPLVPDVRLRQIDAGDRTVAGVGFGTATPGQRMLQWEGGRSLYKRMRAYADLHGKEAGIDAFYGAATTGKLGAYHQADSLVNDLAVLSSADAAALSQQLTLVHRADSTLNARLALLASVGSWADSLRIYGQADSILMAAAPAVQQLVQQLQAAEAARKARATAALSAAAALMADDLPERNRKDLLTVYARILEQGLQQPTSADATILSDIAHQCPEEGGSAVYLARALYQLVEARQFDDEVLCNGEDRGRPMSIAPASGLDFVLVPNPAEDNVLVVPPPTLLGDLHITLLNASGQVLLEKRATGAAGPVSLQLGNIPTGVYFCRVHTANTTPTTRKLVINR